MRWKLHLEYDGTTFAGWQLQGDRPTVQRDVEAALARLLGHPARVFAAGRTDAGVHAAMQVACFDTEVVRSPREIRDGLNAHLPPTVACVAASEVPSTFDARRAPHTKTYRYTFIHRPARSPLRVHRGWHVRGHLDVPAMHAAVQAMVGTHDLTAFRAVGCTSTHPVRTVLSAEVTEHGDEIHLRVRGTGFLRHSVRILAGCLREVGRGIRPVDWIETLIEGRDRAKAARTAPADGLLLEAIDYHDRAIS